MRRLLIAVTILSLVAVACGGAGGSSQSGSGAVVEAAAVIGSTPPTSTADGVRIPNVSLRLADGSTFDLADIDTPVLMIFWAEW